MSERDQEQENERRAQILRAAERFFGRYGPAKTTIADVAREADVAVGSVYLEFASKEALIEELSSLRHGAVLRAMRAVAEQDFRPFRERLRAALDARVESFLELSAQGTHACDLLHCPKGEAVRAVHARFRQDERTLLLNLIRRGVKSGEFEAHRPEAAVDALLSAYAVFSPPFLFAMPREDLFFKLKSMHDLILYGIVKRGPEKF